MIPFRIPELSHYFNDFQIINLPPNVQILRTGTFNYVDFFGDTEEIEIDSSDFASMVENFKNKVRKIDIALDQAHDIDGPASGWIKNLYTTNSDTELWAEIEFTEPGKKRIANKEYRYLSAEFAFDYQDSETLKTFGPTILGVALTNRPFIKGMQPLTLNEGRNVPAPQNTDVAKLMIEMETAKTQLTELNKKFSDNQTKLTEIETKHKKLSEDYEAQVKKNMELVDENKKIEKNKTFDEKLKSGLVCEAQRTAYLKDDMEEFLKNQAKVNLEGKSQSLSEPGKDDSGEDVQEVILKKAKVLMASEKIELAEAISMVISEDKKLAKKYAEIFQ